MNLIKLNISRIISVLLVLVGLNVYASKVINEPKESLSILACPVFTLPAGPVGFCTGDSIILDCGSADSVLWSNGKTTQKITLKAVDIAGTSKTFIVSSKKVGCTAITKSIVVNLNPLPVAKFANTAVACVGSQIQYTDSSTITPTGALTYKWTFSVDGSDSTSQNPSKLYSTVGSYTVKLEVTSLNACKANTTKSVSITPGPVANFSSINTIGCKNNIEKFTNSSTISSGSITKSLWNFGNGVEVVDSATNALKTESQKYVNSSSFDINLQVYSSNGCSNSISKTFIVKNIPSTAFSVSNLSTSTTSNFTNATSITPSESLTYKWNYGELSNTSTLTSPTYKYTNSGAHTVQLISTSASGCKDTLSKSITINGVPVANFTASTLSACVNSLVSFTNTSTLDYGIMTYLWDFGNGNTSTLQNPSTNYFTPGTYTVKLTATESEGGSHFTTKSITINPLPNASFTLNNACLNELVTLNNTTSIISGTYSSDWILGDGAISSLQSPSHTYTSSNTFKVKLTSTSNLGCIDSAVNNIVVSPIPVANFSVNPIYCTGEAVIITNTSTLSSGIMLNKWTSGTGSTSTDYNPGFEYYTYGTFPITLIASSSNGCADTVSKNISINPKPSISFYGTTPNGGNITTFTNKSSIASGTMNYLWDIQTKGTATSQNATVVFSAPGTYTVKLTATSDQNCVNTKTQNYQYEGDASVPKVFVPTDTVGFYMYGSKITVIKGTQLYINGSLYNTINSGNNQKGNIQNLDSIFIAGNIQNNTKKPLFDTKDGGTVIFRDGFIQTISRDSVNFKNIVIDKVIQNLVLNRGITVSNYLTLKKGTVNFGTYKIDLLDSGLVVGETPFNFLTGDKGWVIARNREFKIGDSLDKASLGLILSPYGDIGDVTLFRRNSSQDSAGEGGIRRFYDVMTGKTCLSRVKFSYLDAEWKGLPKDQNENMFKLWYSNIADSTVQNATKFKQDTNSVADITLNNVQSDSGSFIAKKYQRVTVSDADCDIAPVLTLPTKPQWICVGDTLILDAGTAVSSYKWSNGKSTQVVKIPATSIVGSKDTLSVECYNTAGCRVVRDIVINKKLKPSVKFTAPVSVCKGSSVLYSNKTTVADSQGLAYLWTFYDGTTSTEQNPKFQYDIPNVYTTKLVVTTSYQCKDSTTINSTTNSPSIKVNDVPKAAIELSSSTVCAKVLVGLINKSTVGNNEVISDSRWQFGDSFISDTSSLKGLSNEYKAYSKSGTYTIKLKIRSSGNCYDTTSTTITINPIPVSSFEVKGLTTNFPTSFTPTSTIDPRENLFYNWSFDTLGASSTDNNPVYVYGESKSHKVTLITTSYSGCADTVKQNIITSGNPIANFTFTSPDFCEYSTVDFVDVSTIDLGSTKSYWTFGDGTTSEEKNPSKKYSKPGIYIVKLVSTSEGGGTNSITKNITINAAPDAQFYVAPVCFGSISKFVNNSKLETGTISNAWDMGDLSSAIIDAPSHIYSTHKTYKVRLITTSNAGCVDTAIQNAVVNEMPVADFDITDVCIGSPSPITNKSSISDIGNKLSFNWVLGNNSNSAEESPIVTYSTAGNYTLDLIVSSNAGCTTNSSKKTTIFPAPNVKFSNTLACHGDTTYFTNQSTISVGTINYVWDFGSNETSTDLNAKKVFALPNVYTVQLKAISTNLCETSLTKLVNVNPLPKVDFTSNNTCIGNATNFVNNSTIVAPITENTLGFTWSFGNNKTSNSSNPSLTYSESKVYNVTLSAQSKYGCTASKTDQVEVYNLPIAQFAIDNVCTNSPLTFQNKSKSVDGKALMFDWNFGDGTNSSDSIPAKTFTNEKLNNIELTVTSSKGCESTYSNTVNSYPKPTISLSLAPKACHNLPFVITNNTSIKSGTFTNSWDLGNGSTPVALSPTTTYNAAGNYAINYKAISDKGCEATYTSYLTVNPLPKVDFDVSNDVQSNVVFENKTTISSNEILTYNWNFGNGASSTLTNPIYKYALNGNYSVSLKANSASGCSSTITRIVKYPNSTIADFVDFETQGALCKSNQIQFLNKSDISADTLSYFWKFNDGTTSSLENPVKIFKTSGTFNVQLTVTPSSGSPIIKSKSIVINDLPKVNFVSTDICVNEKAQFVNKSTPISNVSYQWDMGDGTTSSLLSPNKVYTIAGDYMAKLTVTTLGGCTADFVKTFKVNPAPSINLGDTLRTCGTSLPLKAGDNTNTYQWNTGAITAQILTTTNGEYQVTATNSLGCTKNDSVIVLLNDKLKVKLGDDKSVCSDYELDAKNQGSTYLWNTGLTAQKLKVSLAGTYIVSVTDVNNCNAKDTINVTLLASPIAVSLGNDASVCDDKPFKLNVFQANASYKWLNGSTASNLEIKASGIYGVSVTFANECSAKDTISIVMKSSPKFNIGADTIICANELPYFLNSWAKASQYLWSNASTDSSISVNTSGIYIAKATANNGCTYADTATVTINSNPIVNLGNDVSICTGSSVVLDAGNNGNQIKWSTGDITPTITASLPGYYSVEVTNAQTCKAKTKVTVTEKIIVKPDLGVDLKLCTYDLPKTIIAPAGYVSYNWLNKSNTSNTIVVTTAEELIVEVTDATNCTARDTISISQLASPVIELGTDTSFCKGNSFTLNALNPGAHYQWSNGDTTQSIAVKTAGIYGVNITFNNGCKGSDERNVSMFLAPKVDLGSDKKLCLGQNQELNAANFGATYLWSTAETAQNITVSTSANYKVEITDNHGCKASDEILVTFENTEKPTLGADLSSCKSVLLDAGTVSNSYKWSTNETTRNISVSKTGEYVVSTYTTNNCVASDTIAVTINNAPIVKLGKDTTICANQDLILNAGNLGSNYVWSTAEVSQKIKTNKASQFIVRVTNLTNCSASDTINVAVNAVTLFNLGNDKDICIGSSTTVSGPSLSLGGTYLWNTGAVSEKIDITTQGDYALTFINNKNCKTNDTIRVDTHSYPVVKLGNDTTVCGRIVLDAKNSGNKFLWSDLKTSQRNTVLQSGIYIVTVSNSYNCTSKDTIDITIKNKPNVSIGDDITACKGDTTILSVTTDASNFVWNTQENTQKIKVINEGKYFVNASNPNGCTNSDTLLLSIKNKPLLTLKDEYIVCSNATQKIDAGNAGSLFTWTSTNGFTSSQQSIIISGKGTYYLKIKNKEACIALDTIVVKASPNAVYANFLSVSGANVGDTVKMLNMSYPQPFTSKWTFGDGFTSTDVDPIHVYYLDTTVLTRTLTVTNGFCTDTKTKTIKVLRKNKPIAPSQSTKTEYIVSANVYPIPNDGRFVFETELTVDETLHLDLFDMDGHIILSKDYTQSRFHHSLFEYPDLKSGMYFLRMIVQNQSKVFKIIIAK